MENFALVIDKFFEFLYYLLRQKKLFFLIFFFVIAGIFYNQFTSKILYFGQIDVYEGGDQYFTELNSIQEKIAPLGRLKVDFLASANIGFGIKDSTFKKDQGTESIVLLENNNFVAEEEHNIFNNELDKFNIFSKYYSIATRRENQLSFLNNFFKDEDLLTKYGLTYNPETAYDFSNSFEVTYFDNSPLNTNTVNPKFRRLSMGYKSFDRKYIEPVLFEYNKYLNNILNADIEKTIKSFINSNTQKVQFQKDLLNEQLKILQETYKILVKDEIAELQENLSIAKALGFQKNYFYNNKSIAYDIIPNCAGYAGLYCMGYEALQKKIDSLIAREDAAPYIAGFREVQAAIRQLEVDSIGSIAETIMAEYDFNSYKEYVTFDQFSIDYQGSNDPMKFNIAVILLGIIFFILFSLMKKIYTDEKKLIANQVNKT